MSTKTRDLNPGFEKALRYGFGHLVGADRYPDDAHSGDSRNLAHDVFNELGLTEEEIDLIEVLSEYVADYYDYTGERKS